MGEWFKTLNFLKKKTEMHLVFLITTVKPINDNLTSIFSKHTYRDLDTILVNYMTNEKLPTSKKKICFLKHNSECFNFLKLR